MIDWRQQRAAERMHLFDALPREMRDAVNEYGMSEGEMQQVLAMIDAGFGVQLSLPDGGDVVVKRPRNRRNAVAIPARYATTRTR